MATPYSDLYTVFQSQMSDPVFNGLSVRDDLSKQYLINSIPKFRRCLQNLNDRDDANSTFNIDLTDDEKLILGNLTLVEYMSSHIFNLNLIKQSMKNSDFDLTSQAAQLDKLITLRESRKKEISKMIVDYTYNFGDLTKLR